ncbi:hypothetical protein MMC19_001870 [Ptychographa xylographoides]|nr:hypothetical protein [Ptychographa xylographoides]
MNPSDASNRGHVCAIIPPYLLHSIAHSDDVSHETRRVAAATLAHTKILHGHRSRMRHEAHTGGAQPPHRGIVPDHILRNLAASGDVSAETQQSAQRTLQSSQGIRDTRQAVPDLSASQKSSAPHVHREVHDAQNSEDSDLLPGTLLLAEGQVIAQDADKKIGECYANLGHTYDFYSKVLGRDSIDNHGLTLIGTIHYGKDFGNAFWNSAQMVFGDGNEFIYNFTDALDVIGHELTHGVTEKTAGLNYSNQSGALNESVSDVFGIMIKQYQLNQKAEEADWLIGEACLLPGVKGVALRSMKAPGTAFNDPKFGIDPQPASMADYVQSSNDDEGDYGGVHTNSGIPNRAFYLAAVGLGGYAWERAGKVWYGTLLDGQMTPDCDFKTFADITCKVAGEKFTPDVVDTIRKAWVEVGVYDT